ncbi:unnamed protein product [Umbelopsis vinacea]
MASEMGPHTEIIHDDMDTAMNDSLGAPHEAINEEIPEATNLDHNNVDSVNYNAEASYGNDLIKPLINFSIAKGVIIRDGKLVYPEKKLRMNNHETVATDMVEFRKYRANTTRVTTSEEPYTIPDNFHALIALLVQDSDEAITSLSGRLNDTLSQFDAFDSDSDEPDDKQFNDALENTIKSLAYRERYGVSNEVLQGLTGVPNVVPAHLSIYRWEVKDISGFPSDIKNAVEKRRRKRVEMSITATRMFRTLTSEQQLQLLCAKRKKNSAPLPRINVSSAGLEFLFSSKENNPITNGESMLIADENLKEAVEAKKKEALRKTMTEEKEAEFEEKRKKKEEERKRKDEEKKKKDEERRAKDEEKKKREEEQQKKERSQLRLTSLFKTTSDERPAASSEVAVDPHIRQVFPRFHVKEHVQMANSSAFRCTLSENFESIINSASSNTANNKTAEVMLDEFKQSFGSALQKRRGVDHKIDLRTLLGHDPSMPLATAASLDGRDLRSILKMKFLQFREDIRPAYWGTWTKSSKVILPRRPFAKDTEFLDYDLDSEAEWEPEEDGEDIKSGDDEDEDVDIADPDDAGWLVPEGYLSNDEGIGSDKEEDGVRTNTYAKKNGPVKQICIGVMFEDSSDEDELLAAYSIQPLGTPYPIDPFSVVANKQQPDPAEQGSSSPLTVIDFKRVAAFPTEQTPQLIDAIKGKAEGMPKLIAEVKAMQGFEDVPKRQIEAKIKTIAVKEKRGSDARPIWYIK